MKDILLYGSFAVIFYFYVVAYLGGKLMRWYDWHWWYRGVYLKSYHWQFKKFQKKISFALKGRILACEKCGNTKGLQFHHVTYKRLYRERMDDLQVICSKCHRKGSGRI